jgi:hypothetical protein
MAGVRDGKRPGRKTKLIPDDRGVQRRNGATLRLAEHRTRIQADDLPGDCPAPNPDERIEADPTDTIGSKRPAKTRA